MPDVLIRDVPAEDLARIDALAARLKISRTEYLRRRLHQEAAYPSSPVEIGYSARGHQDLHAGLREPPVVAMPVEYATPAAEDRAIEILTVLADRGHHRAPSVPDLLVAAITDRAGLVVLHQDKDFDLIAQVAGQPTERLSD
jgi:predicted nucleic acid-binding protein